MKNNNLFELNLDELLWKWDIIDFWALPLHQKGHKPQLKKEEKERNTTKPLSGHFKKAGTLHQPSQSNADQCSHRSLAKTQHSIFKRRERR